MTAIFRLSIPLCTLTVLVVAAGVGAQLSAPKFLKAAPSVPKTVQAGRAFAVSVPVTIASPYHIQANPAKDGYIATELEVGPIKGFKVDKVTYPKPMMTTIAGEQLPVYEGKVEIRAEISADKGLKPGKYVIPITLKYQGCDEQKCFPPTTTTARVSITVTAGAAHR